MNTPLQQRIETPSGTITDLALGGLAVTYPATAKGEQLAFELHAHMSKAAALTGERIELRWLTRVHDGRFTLLRRPDRSRIEIKGSGIIPDVRGCYLVQASVGAWSRVITVAAWELADLNRLGKRPEPGQADLYWVERRRRLQSLLNDGRATPESIIDALEGNSTGCVGLDGSLYGTPGQGISTSGW